MDDSGVTEALDLNGNGAPYRSVSPFLELGAYEALWLRGATFKQIADMFRQQADIVPSNLVPESEARACAEQAVSMIQEAGVERFGIRVHGAGEYPSKLRDARHPVELLYFRGWWKLVETRCVSVVGTRRVSKSGADRTRKLVKHLVEDGYTIASGLAQGVDTVAHETAIRCDGKTVAVIGTPIHQCYPRENKELQEELAQRYLVVSQVPVLRASQQDYRSNRAFFPERNVTMSALSLATIIVEASDTSGTLIQARAALHQGRLLFILDSCFRNPDIEWPHKYLKQGAIRVSDYDDIKDHLSKAVYSHRRVATS